MTGGTRLQCAKIAAITIAVNISCVVLAWKRGGDVLTLHPVRLVGNTLIRVYAFCHKGIFSGSPPRPIAVALAPIESLLLCKVRRKMGSHERRSVLD